MDITKAFEVNSLTVYDFFTRGKIGFNIPQYQRQYSWDSENIEQLMDDICRGMSDVLNDDNEIHFMGTIITVEDQELRRNVNDPVQKSALPTKIENIIDGQQRLSTISLLACCLYEILNSLNIELPETDDYSSLREANIAYLNMLEYIFSYNLSTRGCPSRKPIIIREAEDKWTLDGDDNNFYKSDVTAFLAKFIRATDAQKQKMTFPETQGEKLTNNIKKIRQFLENVKNAHEINIHGSIFPPAWEIIEKINQENFWEFNRTEQSKSIHGFVKDRDKNVCTLIQVLGFSYYLLKCCCFTSIVPTSEVRAFDMFQSLNATGTPLTALETFKPLVVNSVTSAGNNFEESNFKLYFDKIDSLFEQLTSANSKIERTNEYLTLYAQTYNGYQLSKQFSKQRKWLNDIYNNLNYLQEKELFIRNMGDVAFYCKQFLYSTSEQKRANFVYNNVDENQKDLTESKEAAISILYLFDAKHKMAHTILSRFFSLARHGSNNQKQDFISSCKAIAAFFTLWRAAIAGKYPDGEYRKLLQESEITWDNKDNRLTAQLLKLKLLHILKQNGIYDKTSFVNQAVENLRYKKSQTVCKFVLFVTANNTIIDTDILGLMKIGRTGTSSPYLDPTQWYSPNFKTIEHIAPQDEQAKTKWDAELYENENYDKIGNLTLLPSKVNTSASNKGWSEKYIYYSYLAEQDTNNLKQLKKEADEQGIILNNSTIELLKQAEYNHHILPLIQIGIYGNWNKNLVDLRSQRICEILWERMYEWLS